MYAAMIENRGDARYHATSRGYRFVLGPEGQGANAGDTLLAALCACIGHYVQQFFRERRLALDGFTLDARAEATPDESRLARIEVRLDLAGVQLEEPQRAELLAFVERCRIHRTLRAGCAIEVTLGRRDVAEAPRRVSPGGCA
jgi:uncharacterized OsmC-like protein